MKWVAIHNIRITEASVDVKNCGLWSENPNPRPMIGERGGGHYSNASKYRLNMFLIDVVIRGAPSKRKEKRGLTIFVSILTGNSTVFLNLFLACTTNSFLAVSTDLRTHEQLAQSHARPTKKIRKKIHHMCVRIHNIVLSDVKKQLTTFCMFVFGATLHLQCLSLSKRVVI